MNQSSGTTKPNHLNKMVMKIQLKLYTSTGKFIGEIEFDDLDEALECAKSHIESNDTIVVIGDIEYLSEFK